MRCRVTHIHRLTIFFLAFLLVSGTTRQTDASSTTTPRATSTAVATTTFAVSTVPKGNGVVDCFTYYHKDSVQVSLTPATTTVATGTVLTISGTITNQNPYPIVNGALYIKIMRLGTKTPGSKVPIGFDVVDQYVVRDGITLPARESVPVSFTWPVPQSALSGEYRIVPYITLAQKYPISDIPFVDEMMGTTTRFVVQSRQTTGVSFVRDSIKLNNKPFISATSTVHISPTSTPLVSVAVMNTTKEKAPVSITWRLYARNVFKQENLITERISTSTVAAKKRITVSYKVEDTTYSEYTLVGEVQWKDSKSYLTMRVVRDRFDQPQADFLSIDMFPLVQGQAATMFSCIHNANKNILSDGRLELVLSDREGNPIHSYSYTGRIGGDILGLAEQFVPDQNYDYFSLDMRLYQGKTLLDETYVTYDCSQINPSLCTHSTRNNNGVSWDHMTIITSFSLITLALLGTVIAVKSRNRHRHQAQ